MVDIIVGINAAIETLTKLKEVNEKVKDADVKMLIADLGIQLAEAKISIADLLDKNRELQDEIKKLKETKGEKLVFKNGAYFDEDENGPYCPGCYDKGKVKSRLVPNTGFEMMGNYKCGVCGKPFSVKK